MSKISKPLLVPVDYSITREPFDPQRNYFRSLSDKQEPRHLIPQEEVRHPTQPPMPHQNPAMNADVRILASLSPVPAEHLSQLKDDFYRAIRENSLKEDVAMRSFLRREETEQSYRDFWLKTKLDELLKINFLFSQKADSARKARGDFLKLRQKYADNRQPEIEQRLRIRDQNQQESWESFNAAVLKGLEKMPREIVLSGHIIGEILSEMYNSQASKVLHAYRRAQEYLLRTFADQLNDHSNVNTSSDILYFNSILDQEPIIAAQTKKYRELADDINFASMIKSRQHHHAINTSAEELLSTRRDRQIIAYWQEFDHENQTIIRSQMLSSTNQQSQANELSRQAPHNINRVLRTVEDNQLAALAEVIAEHSGSSLPDAVLFALSILEPKYPKMSQIIGELLDQEQQNRKLIGTSDKALHAFHKLRNHNRKLFGIEESKQSASQYDGYLVLQGALNKQSLRAVEGQQMYWQVYDQLHAHNPRAISSQTRNSNTILRELGHQASSEIQYFLSIILERITGATNEEIAQTRQAFSRRFETLNHDTNHQQSDAGPLAEKVEASAPGDSPMKKVS